MKIFLLWRCYDSTWGEEPDDEIISAHQSESTAQTKRDTLNQRITEIKQQVRAWRPEQDDRYEKRYGFPDGLEREDIYHIQNDVYYRVEEIEVEP